MVEELGTIGKMCLACRKIAEHMQEISRASDPGGGGAVETPVGRCVYGDWALEEG